MILLSLLVLLSGAAVLMVALVVVWRMVRLLVVKGSIDRSLFVGIIAAVNPLSSAAIDHQDGAQNAQGGTGSNQDLYEHVLWFARVHFDALSEVILFLRAPEFELHAAGRAIVERLAYLPAILRRLKHVELGDVVAEEALFKDLLDQLILADLRGAAPHDTRGVVMLRKIVHDCRNWLLLMIHFYALILYYPIFTF